MANYAYVAVDPRGAEMRGTLDVTDQSEAIRRIKDMGLFPTKLFAPRELTRKSKPIARAVAVQEGFHRVLPQFGGRVRARVLSVFTRQLATLVEAGMPLLRGLRTLEEQEANPVLKRVIGEMSEAIENGSSLAEAMSAHPKVFNRLYQNMVRAGEISGALETTLKRLSEFMEKAQRIKGKVKAAMFYPAAVLFVAGAILILLMTVVVPKFKAVFEGLSAGRPLPPFTLFVFGLSELVKNHVIIVGSIVAVAAVSFTFCLRLKWGRYVFDRFKLWAPILGPLFRKAAISRFARTLGTLVSSGVPILQALTIVKETAGNMVIGRVVSKVHENVKQGEPIAPTLKASRIFPLIVAGMVDIGEQTGALPEMLMKVADNYDEEVDNAASALTSLLEPIMIVILAVIVGSIVIAMFLPIITLVTDGGLDGSNKDI
jgi:type IV pilus assembly protein PilC